jgi:hypothetical protein
MKKEFEVLKEVLFNSNTYDPNGNCNWSEVSNLLEKLWDKIDEVEKRIECSVRSSAEANKSILLYTERVDNNETFQMNVDDHDSILRGTNDVLIALNMNDTECIDNNWYNLFSPTEEPKPIAVGNIEYEFPEEVYTIGNADNTEIIGDVYESAFHELLDLGILVLEGSNDFPFGKANYIVLDNKFISIVKKKQIDLSKVPIKKEVFMTFHSSWGEIDCDREGKVIEIRGDEYFNEERNYMYDIEKFDLVEYGKFCESKDITMGESEDILTIGFWRKDGEYGEPDHAWRSEMFPPTMQCMDCDTHRKVKEVINILKTLDNGNGVDGETMEFILKQVGMQDQMLKQLFAQTTNDEIDYLLDVRNGKG